MKTRLSVILMTLSMVLFLLPACSDNNELPDENDPPENNEPDTIDSLAGNMRFTLDLQLLHEGIPVKDVSIDFEDTTFITGLDGSFSVERDSGAQLEFIFTHPVYLRDSLSLLLVQDTTIQFELTPAEGILGNYYPVILHQVWKYQYTYNVWLEPTDPPLTREYILERKIIEADGTHILSELHAYGMEISIPDTVYFDTVYQVTETIAEDGRINTFHEIYRINSVPDTLVMNRYMSPGFNEGRTDFEFVHPLILKEYESDNSISGTLCLYTDLVGLFPYSPLDFNVLYLSETHGLVELFLQYWGMALSYDWRIRLVDFYEE